MLLLVRNDKQPKPRRNASLEKRRANRDFGRTNTMNAREPNVIERFWRCESCGHSADVMLKDGSRWCRACDDSARRLGYDDESEAAQ